MEKIITKSEQEMIPLKNIKVNPLNTFEKDKYEDVKNSIISYGLITPISVIGPDENDCYTLIAGEQRYHVYEELNKTTENGYDKMPAYIVGDINMSPTEQQLLIEASNLDTRDLPNKHEHYFTVVKLMKNLAEEKGLNKADYIKLRSEYFKCSSRYARFYEQIFNSDNEDLQQLVIDGKLSVSRAGRIATMPESEQKEALEDLKSGIKQDDVLKKHTKTTCKKDQYEDDVPDSELNMFDPFDSGYQDNDLLESDIDFDEDIDFNSFNTSSLHCNSVSGEKDQSSNKNIRTVLAWCEHMKKVSKPSDEEWEAIEACKVIVNKFL